MLKIVRGDFFMIQIRTDLALEAKEIYGGSSADDDGILSESEKTDDIEINRVRIVSKEGAKKLGKKIGSYVTLEMPKITDRNPDFTKCVAIKFCDEISKMLKEFGGGCVLAAGLGNRSITSDSLGPKVVSGLLVTRHLKEYMPHSFGENLRGVCAISPGVLGTTGIETGEIIKSICMRIKPDVVVAIDALAARRVERVNTTIQISDTGISPGAGVGNKRFELSRKTLGVPVIAVGVPTVVDAATIAVDALEAYMDDSDREKLADELLPPYYKNLIVSPKNTDAMISDISGIISAGLNMAFQPGLCYEDAIIFRN